MSNVFQDIKKYRADRKEAKRLQHKAASQQTLVALNSPGSGKHIYAGTVPYKDKVANRRRNKVARRSRRINRQR